MGVAKAPVMTPWGVEFQDAKVEIDEPLLREIAQETGGKYFRATDNTKLAEIYNEINQMEKGTTTITNVVSYDELFLKYVLWALAALLAELLLNWFVIKRMP
jgi:Ca-activated chloride channel family protein